MVDTRSSTVAYELEKGLSTYPGPFQIKLFVFLPLLTVTYTSKQVFIVAAILGHGFTPLAEPHFESPDRFSCFVFPAKCETGVKP